MATNVIDIRRANVDAMDLSHMHSFVAWHPDSKYFLADREHYRLLAFLAQEVTRLFPSSPVVDIGSHLGHSAAALRAGAALTSPIYTLDHGVQYAKALPCGTIEIAAELYNIRVEPPTREPLQELRGFIQRGCMLMAIDTEPHDGTYERAVIQALMDENFQGLLVVDETRLNEHMKHLLNWTPVKKIDVTSVAHWSGTAVLVFNPAVLDCTLD